MNSYCLNIADYRIKIVSEDAGLRLEPAERFAASICSDDGSDVTIRVHSGTYNMPEGTERVFHAPIVEEMEGSIIKKDDTFWSIYSHRSSLFIKTVFPWSGPEKKAILKFSLSDHIWDLWFEGAGTGTDPFEYPLDGLILYYLTAINGDIMIHASGVNHNGKGYIFSGVSGKGKSTMAGLWNEAGSRVIHDDRLIIRNTGGSFIMFNTPVYKNDVPSRSVASNIFLIDHGSENMMVPVNGAHAVSLLLANCVQHNWNRNLVAKLIGSVSALCTTVPVARLYFKPDKEILDFILRHE